MPLEDTVLEPPATPAPVFAWRAFKSAVWGSPESSPEHENKENVPLHHLHLKSLDGTTDAAPSSPLKRKRDSQPLVSPTKSILRTPGVPTPRTKSLRDINVKFKSLSPELRLREQPQPKAGVQNAEVEATSRRKVLRVEVRKDNARQDDKPAQKALPSTQNKLGTAPGTTDSQIHDADFQNYCRRTEKETKKLLRHNQRLRDYGRQADAENLKLKKLLEEAQRENRRMTTSLNSTLTRLDNALSENRSLRASRCQPAEQIAAKTDHQMKDSRKTPEQQLEYLLAPTEERRLDSKESQPAKRSSSTTLEAAMPPPPRPQIPMTKPTFQQSQFNVHSPLTDLAFRLEGGPPPPPTAQRTNLPADRLHAIRQRLASKAEARKTSAASTLGDSQIDWVAFGR